MCAAIFAVDIANMLDSAVGIGYLLAVRARAVVQPALAHHADRDDQRAC